MAKGEHDLTTWDLEWFAIFCVCVANKTEAHGRRVTEQLCHSPFGSIRSLLIHGKLGARLRELRSGQYTRLEKALGQLATGALDLRTCSVSALECIHGIGPKTARYFILRTRPGARVAALDTHILKWLRVLGHKAPKSTPSGRSYARWEQVFLGEADRLGLSPQDLDHRIWMHYAKGEGDLP